jgi:cobalt-zinc-cadmium efflux system membrane fusion protein
MGFGWRAAARRLLVVISSVVTTPTVITPAVKSIAIVATVTIVATGVAWRNGLFAGATVAPAALAQSQPTTTPPPAAAAPSGPPVIELAEKQLAQIKIAVVGDHVFPVQKEAVGSIDFDEDLAVPVFTLYQGKIISAFAQVGDDVRKGQPLFTIDSPDLVQAESTLIGAAATFDQNNRALIRAQRLYATQGTGGIAEKDVDAAVQGKLSAEGALKAARDAVRIFGKTEAEIDAIVARRAVDPVLLVSSPITGRVTARNAQPGLFVQPGNAPAPYSVADISTMWMLASIPEIDSAAIKLGQAVKVSVMAYPGQVYDGKITTVAATVDPSLHTLQIRSEILDPRHELRPGMLANFVIVTGAPISATAVPADSVVREGDGTMTAWVTSDRHHFTQVQIKIGLRHDGFVQVLDGLKIGDSVASEGAVFLDNMLTASPTD